MRTPFVAGNWKMHKTLDVAVALAKGVFEAAAKAPGVDVAVCPPSVYLLPVGEALAGGRVALGAQNMYFKPDGAFTGEVSAAMLADVGCEYVILGHSERRHVFGESDELIAKKVLAALDSPLAIILCIGEKLDERKAKETEAVLRRQTLSALESVSAEQMARITLAYEPVWAIGTGVTASPDEAQQAHAFVRGLIVERYDAGIAEALRIQYGGSVKPNNAAELLAQPDVDGALVGGAALKVEDFAAIIEAGQA